MTEEVWTVFLAATVTALMTGLGAVPFFFLKKINEKTIRLSTAAAGGLMLAACHSLIAEGVVYSSERVILGLIAGIIAIFISKRLIARNHDVYIANLSGANATKALLILGIMTAHSFGEGVGIGVSFSGENQTLGMFITTAISLHNVPEGLAISLVLVPRGTPVWKAILWSIFTSLPQPLMAVPSFLFVQIFEPFLPVGLGIAAGAMLLMVFAELIPDAMNKEEDYPAGFAITIAFICMLAFQFLVLQ